MIGLCIYLAVGFFIGGIHWEIYVDEDASTDERSRLFLGSILLALSWMFMPVMWLGEITYRFLYEQYGGEE